MTTRYSRERARAYTHTHAYINTRTEARTRHPFTAKSRGRPESTVSTQQSKPSMEFTFGLSSELRSERNDTIALRLLHDIDINSRYRRSRARAQPFPRAQIIGCRVFEGCCCKYKRARASPRFARTSGRRSWRSCEFLRLRASPPQALAKSRTTASVSAGVTHGKGNSVALIRRPNEESNFLRNMNGLQNPGQELPGSSVRVNGISEFK